MYIFSIGSNAICDGFIDGLVLMHTLRSEQREENLASVLAILVHVIYECNALSTDNRGMKAKKKINNSRHTNLRFRRALNEKPNERCT